MRLESRHLVHRYVPPPSGELTTVIVVLHGRGDSPAGFAWMPSQLALPQVGYLLLQAPDPSFDGWSWYDLPPNQGPGVLRSRASIAATLDDLVAAGIPSTDLVLFGFSQGCLMAVDVGLRYPHRLGGVCGISGYVMWPERAEAEASPHARTLPWLVTAGFRDPTIRYATTEADVRMLTAAGIPIDFRGFDKDHTIDPRRELPELRSWLSDRTRR